MVWSSWSDLEGSSERWEPAVYQIRLLNGPKPFPIPRLLGIDNEALLTNGQTNSLEGRRNDFRRALKVGSKHSAGNLLFLLLEYSRMKKCIKNPNFQYRFAEAPSKTRAIELELELLRAYLQKYGELPPLNSSVPDKYGLRLPDAKQASHVYHVLQQRKDVKPSGCRTCE